MEPDTVVQSFSILRGSTTVAEGAEIGPHAVVVDTEIGPRTLVGPFCYLRPGTVLEQDAKAGAFVEIKKSRIGRGAKVPHLSYIGDAEIGDGTNIGAGSITANFPHEPGKPKGKTTTTRDARLPWTRCSWRRSQWATTCGRRPAPSSRTTSRQRARRLLAEADGQGGRGGKRHD